ncbi:MAG: hypothetical protein IIY33_07620, partial [Erysipelotrichaceae bacterium]|nr:hypothetical protein [Erysipelotrichaceae bacterium]
EKVPPAAVRELPQPPQEVRLETVGHVQPQPVDVKGVDPEAHGVQQIVDLTDEENVDNTVLKGKNDEIVTDTNEEDVFSEVDLPSFDTPSFFKQR